MLFDVIDTTDALKKNFSYLGPGQAPYYWIVIGLEIFIFKATNDLPDEPWLLAFAGAAFLLMVCVGKAFASEINAEEGVEAAQLRIARVVGIAVPLLAAAFCFGRAKFNPVLAGCVTTAALTQVMVFLFVVNDKPSGKDKLLNAPQLLVICSSLAFSTLFGFSLMSSKLVLSTLPTELIQDHAGELIKSHEAAVKAQDAPTAQPATPPRLKPATEAENAALRAMYAKAREARAALDDESAMPMVPAHKLLYEFAPERALQIPKQHVDSAKAQIPRLISVTSLLLATWLVVLAATAIHSIRSRS